MKGMFHCSHAHMCTLAHVNYEQSLEIDADIKIPTGDQAIFTSSDDVS